MLSESAPRRAGVRTSRSIPTVFPFALAVSGNSLEGDCATLLFIMREGRFYKFWVYIMASRTGTLYVGMTGFLGPRIGKHKSGLLEGFTKKYGCVRLVYYESYSDIGQAKRREIQLKGWRREKKIALIEKVNPRWEDLAEHLGQEVLFRGQSLKRTP
jgi:putative endonuclease